VQHLNFFFETVESKMKEQEERHARNMEELEERHSALLKNIVNAFRSEIQELKKDSTNSHTPSKYSNSLNVLRKMK